MKTVCTVCGTVAVGITGRVVDADDLGAAVVCRQVLQCGPGCIHEVCVRACVRACVCVSE